MKNQKIKEIEEKCKECDMYNSFGCTNTKGQIICSIRDYLIKYKSEHKEELPYNWIREI